MKFTPRVCAKEFSECAVGEVILFHSAETGDPGTFGVVIEDDFAVGMAERSVLIQIKGLWRRSFPDAGAPVISYGADWTLELSEIIVDLDVYHNGASGAVAIVGDKPHWVLENIGGGGQWKAVSAVDAKRRAIQRVPAIARRWAVRLPAQGGETEGQVIFESA